MGIRPENIHDEQAFMAAYPDACVDVHVELTELMGSETYLYLSTDGKGEISLPAWIREPLPAAAIALPWDLMPIGCISSIWKRRIQFFPEIKPNKQAGSLKLRPACLFLYAFSLDQGGVDFNFDRAVALVLDNLNQTRGGGFAQILLGNMDGGKRRR